MRFVSISLCLRRARILCLLFLCLSAFLGTAGAQNNIGTEAGISYAGPLPPAVLSLGCPSSRLFGDLPTVPFIGQSCPIVNSSTCACGIGVDGGGSTQCSATWCGAQWLACGCATSTGSGGIQSLNATPPLFSSGGSTPTLTATNPYPTVNGGTGSTISPTSGQLLIGSPGGGAYTPQDMSGDATITSGGAITVSGTGGVPFGSLAMASAPLASNSGGTGVVSPIPHGIAITEGASPINTLILGANQVLAGTAAGDPLAMNLTNCTNDGTHASIFTGGAWLCAAITGSLTGVTASAPLNSSGGATPNISATNPYPAANGGTGSTAVPSAGQLPVGNAAGTAYAPQTVTGDLRMASTGAATVLSAGGVPFGPLSTASSPLGSSNGGTGTMSPTAHGVLVAEGGAAMNTLVLGANQILAGAAGSDPIAMALTNCTNDGSHASIFTAGAWSCAAISGTGGGVTAVTATAPILSSGGLAPVISATNPYPAAYGGTGSSTVPAAGQMPLGNAGGTAYAPQTMTGDATITSAGAITVSKTGGTALGPLATASAPLASSSGGTGAASLTAHGVAIGEGTAAMSTLVLGANQILAGAAGADPVAMALTNCTNDGSHASIFTAGAWTCAAITGSGGGTGTIISGSTGQSAAYNATGTTLNPSTTQGVDANAVGMISNEVADFGNVTSGSAIVQLTSGSFAIGTTMVGYGICVDRGLASGESLCTTIASVTDSTHAVMSVAAGANVTGTNVSLGYDNYSILNTATGIAAANVAGGSPWGGYVRVAAGRYMFCGPLLSGLCNGAIQLTAPGVHLIGAGMDATRFYLGGWFNNGSSAPCASVSAHPEDGTQFLVSGNTDVVNGLSLYSLNNNADCVAFVGNSISTANNQVFQNIRIANTEGPGVTYETAMSGQQNPIALYAKSSFNALFDNLAIGPLSSAFTNNGFRENIVTRTVQSATFRGIFEGLLESNMGLTPPVIFDANPVMDFGTGGGNNEIRQIDCDVALVCGWNGGSSSASLLVTGIEGGDSIEINPTFTHPYPAEWEPNAIYLGGQFVVPVISVSITSCSDTTHCTPSSTTGLLYNQRIVLPGAGALASIDYQTAHTYASAGATMPGVIILPTSGNAGHYLFQVTAIGSSGAVSSGSAPTWPQTLGLTVGDGTGATAFTWKNIGVAPLGQAWPSGSGSDAFYITAISSAGVITLDHATNGTYTPTTLVYRNYAGHVFRAGGALNVACYSGATQPTWVNASAWPYTSTTTQGTATDSASTTPCAWFDYGPGAFMVNTATAGQAHFDNMNIAGGYFGVLNQSSNGSVVSVTNSFITNQLDGISEISGGALNVTGNSFNATGKSTDFLWTDSGSNRVNFDNSNFLYTSGNLTKCPVYNGRTPNSVIMTNFTVCGPGAPTIVGTSGTAYCRQDYGGGGAKTATCYLSGYANTGTAQTWTYPAPYSTVPLVSGTTCGANGTGLASSATVLTLPAGASMSAGSCQIIIQGQ